MRQDEQTVRTGIADLLDTLLGTGCRIGEALALKWKHLDLDGPKPSVLIDGAVVRLRGGGMFIQPHPKGGPNGKRRLFLHNWTVLRLAARRALVAHDPEDLVFPSARGTLRDPRNARKQLERILTTTRIHRNPAEPAYRPQDRRHTTGRRRRRPPVRHLHRRRSAWQHRGNHASPLHPANSRRT
ncbi:tyrosine-type recombinase/integrase [Nocardia sp. NPDC004604]|uniref:tyrosine-type recombinase/integrase n=1 Tax=Nocardia sp. NPDC004604 TaxID=3157013 RepID=UPI00339EEAFD